MKKIVVEKKEGVADLIERIIGEEDSEITLIIPKGSALRDSVSNFHLIKREADSAGKNIFVESVDDGVLAYAAEAGLATDHPLFKKGGAAFSDIVPRENLRREEREEGEEEPFAEPKRAKAKKGEVKTLKVHSEEPRVFHEEPRAQKELPRRMEFTPPSYDEEVRSSRRPWRKYAGIFLGIAVPIAAIAVVIALLSTVFAHATATINLKRTPWSYSGSLVADRAASAVDTAKNVIPGELFTAQKNTTQLFPASGKQIVSEKATGQITIFNAYSSEKQGLVAKTRFVTPDGKIFRLVNPVTVPGATVKNGSIIPSSIDAPVAADAPGPAYNVGPVDKLTIPGFSGSPKYNGFYGSLKQGTSGGFSGEKAVPTADDIAAAKTKTTDILKSALMSGLASSYPADFKVLDGASDVSVTKLTVNPDTDANGNFSVFAEGAVRLLGFRESDVKSFLLANAQKDQPGTVFDNVNVSYAGIKADFANGTLSFSASAQGSLKTDFDAENFRGKILGQKIGDARMMIGNIPGLEDAKISIWPIWVSTLPSSPSHVTVNVN